MGMLPLDLNPPPEKLRQFGWIAPVMLTIIAIVMRWRFGMSWTGVSGLCLAGLLVLLASRISTKLVRPVYVGLILAGFPIGWLVSHVMMFAFYFGILTPLAILFRLLGRDSLQRRWDRQRESYWTECPRCDNSERYFRQF